MWYRDGIQYMRVVIIPPIRWGSTHSCLGRKVAELLVGQIKNLIYGGSCFSSFLQTLRVTAIY
jgi:hypothetical protein